MRYFLFPREAAAYRIANIIAEIAKEEAVWPEHPAERLLESLHGELRRAKVGTALEEARTPEEYLGKEGMHGVLRKMRGIRKRDEKLFGLVLKELERHFG